MKSYPFVQVDAFTRNPFEGNPCAVVFDADGLTAIERQQIAFEMNLSETAFVVSPAAGDLGARYFTPAEEIPLAGHPTIATVYAMFMSGRIRRPNGRHQIALELRDGPITVEVSIVNGNPEEVVMSQRKPKFMRTYPAHEIAPVFGLREDDIRTDAPVQTVSTGTPQLFIPLKNLDALRKASVDHQAYRTLRTSGDFFSPHLFVTEGLNGAGTTFARHFGVPPDTTEDPFTGSATGGMGAFCFHYGLLKARSFVAEQGHWMGRPGRASVELVGPPDDIETVKVGGNAVLVMRGEITIP